MPMSSSSKIIPSTCNASTVDDAPPGGETLESTHNLDVPSIRSKPTASSDVLSASERRKLVERPFGRVIYRGSSCGHGGCEMPPTVDSDGNYHGDNPWRSRRKPSLSEY